MAANYETNILEPEEQHFLEALVIAYTSLPREEWQDFVYKPSLVRVKGDRPKADIEKAFDGGGVVTFGGDLWYSKQDVILPLFHRQ